MNKGVENVSCFVHYRVKGDLTEKVAKEPGTAILGMNRSLRNNWIHPLRLFQRLDSTGQLIPTLLDTTRHMGVHGQHHERRIRAHFQRLQIARFAS